MRLESVTVRKFRNFIDPQTIQIESDVTALVGKNESGKSTILHALHRLNPANGDETEFDTVVEYPRSLLSRERKSQDLSQVEPVVAYFSLNEREHAKFGSMLGAAPPDGTLVRTSRQYDGDLTVEVECSLSAAVFSACEDVGIEDTDRILLAESENVSEAKQKAKDLAQEANESEQPPREKALKRFGAALDKYRYFTESGLDEDSVDQIIEMIPEFFYFSNYDILPGTADLTELAGKVSSGHQLNAKERAVVSLLNYAGEDVDSFLDENYSSRKAELQAAGADLSQQVFDYWKQNDELSVSFDTDMPVVGHAQDGREIRHRILQVEMRDERHGGVETNFETRSAGFQWFFSFLSAFSEYQGRGDSVIVLLDEPGTSLHGDAQRDFLKFIYEKLGASSQQVMYTTHSQHMIDPKQYEKIRGVTDRATKKNPRDGVVVTKLGLAADRDTVLPVEAALGYSISQHLFIGSGHHLLVEGSSDFVFLQRVSEHLRTLGRASLNAHIAMIPVGSADNMAPFVALFGGRLQVSALVDGISERKKARIVSAAEANGLSAQSIVLCSEIEGVPNNADIEDMFAIDDYLRLYSWTFTTITEDELSSTSEPILKRLEDARGEFDHALPAHTLTSHIDDFFAACSELTLARFEGLIERLNSTVR